VPELNETEDNNLQLAMGEISHLFTTYLETWIHVSSDQPKEKIMTELELLGFIKKWLQWYGNNRYEEGKSEKSIIDQRNEIHV
jgi:hypothetical protein